MHGKLRKARRSEQESRCFVYPLHATAFLLYKRVQRKQRKRRNDHTTNIAQRFQNLRSLTFRIARLSKLYETAYGKMEQYATSINEAQSGEKKDLLLKLSRLEDLKAEIETLEKDRRKEQQELKLLSDTIKSEHQRLVIEAYYYQALSWGEVATLIYGKDTERFRRHCQTHRYNAITAINKH